MLDLACGAGRHARHLAALGHSVLAVDRDEGALAGLAAVPAIETRCADLEAGGWPLAGERFDGIIVTNYLHRPLLPSLIGALKPDGVLLYETFARGNAAFGRPSNPHFLLEPGELLRFALAGGLAVVAFEEGVVTSGGRPAAVQRVAALGADRPRPVPLPANHPAPRAVDAPCP